MDLIISKTGKAHGWGSDPWQWVSYLTPGEKQAIEDESAHVLVTDCPPCKGGANRDLGCTVRRVIMSYGRLYHRCACAVLEQHNMDRHGKPQTLNVVGG